jgi:transcriptional regulator with XRE-family HTH domain
VPSLDPDEVVANVGLRIAEIRKARGYTQERFARLLKFTYQYVSRLEGGRNLTIHTLVRIANKLEVPPQDLFATPTTPSEPRKRGRPPKKKTG